MLNSSEENKVLIPSTEIKCAVDNFIQNNFTITEPYNITVTPTVFGGYNYSIDFSPNFELTSEVKEDRNKIPTFNIKGKYTL